MMLFEIFIKDIWFGLKDICFYNIGSTACGLRIAKPGLLNKNVCVDSIHRFDFIFECFPFIFIV